MALTMLLLAACRGSAPALDPENPVTLTAWHYYNGGQKQAFDSLVAEFNRTVGVEQGIVVEGYSQGGVNALAEKLLGSVKGKIGEDSPPDIVLAYADTAYVLHSMGVLSDLSNYFTEQELAEYRAEYIEEGRIGSEGELYIFPVAKSTEVLCLNQTDWDRFAQATGAELSALETIEGVTKTAEAYYNWTDSLTSEPDDGTAFFGRDALANYILVGARQLGTEIFDAGNGEVTLNLDKDIFRRLWDNFYLPYINGWFCSYGRFRSGDMQTGDLIAYVGSTSGVIYLPDAVMVNDVDEYEIETVVLPTPVFEGGEKFAVQQGAGMSVIQSTPEKEYAASVFLRWFTDVEQNAAFSATSAYLPVKLAGNDLNLLCGAVDNERKLTEMFEVALDQLQEYTLYTPKAFQNGTQAREIIESALNDAAVADRAAVLEKMQQGLSRQEAVAEFDTDERFEHWFKELSDTLYAAVE